jgi:hypothetical protein
MTVLVWVSLAIAVLATAGTGTFALVRGLDAWRTLRSAQRISTAGFVAVSRGVATAEARMSRADDNATRLQHATAELQESLRIASLLANEVAEARAKLGLRGLFRQ